MDLTTTLTKIGWIAICVAIGLVLTWQAPVNAEAARRLGSPLSAALLSLSFSAVLILAALTVVGAAKPSLAEVASAPWWAWCGGVIGAMFVLGGLLIVPRTGSILFVMSIVTGQMIGAVMIDRFGMWGMEAMPLSTTKLLAIGVVLAGVVAFHLSE